MPSDETHLSLTHSTNTVLAPIEADEAAKALKNGPVGALVVASIAVGLLFIGWLAFYFLLFMPRGPMAESSSNRVGRPLPDGIVPEAIVARTEKRWVMVMAAMLAVMMAIMGVTGVTGVLHPPSNVEVVDPTTLHLHGEFVCWRCRLLWHAGSLGQGS